MRIVLCRASFFHSIDFGIHPTDDGRDWKDHRTICGFREAPGMVRELYPPECSEPENLVRPERMPFRFDMLDA